MELRKSDRLERLWGARKREEGQWGEFMTGDNFCHKTDFPTRGARGAEAPPSWDVFKAITVTGTRLAHAVPWLGVRARAARGRAWKSYFRHQEKHVHRLEG